MEQAFILARQLYKQNLQPVDLYRKKRVTKDQLFIIAYAYYLLGITNKNTQKQYKTVIDHFIRYIANTKETTPLEANGIDVSLWRDDLIRTGGVAGAPPGSNLDRYAPQEKSSIHVKVSILSAFYKFLQKPNLDGSPPLMTHNPVQALQTRFKIERYGNSKKIDRTTLQKILKEIDLDTIKGLRDYTLIFGYFLTGRRNAEWVTLRWGQLNFNTTPATYSFTRKGEKKTVDELPETLQNLILTYLSKRWGDEFYEHIDDNTYLFTAMPGKGGVRQIINPNNPLTERSMLRIIKVYAYQAGLDPKRITVHSLRHLHAESYLEAGASVEEVRARLQHQSLATTQRYVSSMKNEKNRLANKLENMLADEKGDEDNIKSSPD